MKKYSYILSFLFLLATCAFGQSTVLTPTGKKVTIPPACATLSDAAPLAWNPSSTSPSAKVALAHTTSTRALNVSSLGSGVIYFLEMTQDSTGGAALTLGTGCTWKMNGSSTNNTAASSVDVLQFSYDGTNCVGFFASGIASSSGTPLADNTSDLGAASFRWKDAYLAGIARAASFVGSGTPLGAAPELNDTSTGTHAKNLSKISGG